VVKVVPQVAAPPTPEDSLVYNLVAALNFTQVREISVTCIMCDPGVCSILGETWDIRGGQPLYHVDTEVL
jgi:hypothetical protein